MVDGGLTQHERARHHGCTAAGVGLITNLRCIDIHDKRGHGGYDADKYVDTGDCDETRRRYRE